ncbi:type I restriction enzyme, S subunit [Saccharicrinis carchari]|uniref:Type I restriction enzyme, S subunit n=1 Tax=Saccharicrinis carchari TaxID=1168039 RepID=A0A521E1A4_SACCC|nr:restriction endonuclease subunit S [Saccharicrinis carchari]SMO77708.1 type I restriction enzyme, S subunit [Saccharicrinis carchari]
MTITEINTEFKKYSAYQDSGVEWLGEIPERWEIRKIKYLFKEINIRSENGSGDLLSVSQYTGVTKKSDKVDAGELLTNAATLEGYKKVEAGDLVSNIMLAWNGSLGFSPFNGITSPAYSIYRLNTGFEKRYFHYLLRTELYKAEFKRNSSGVIESRLRLYTDDFFNIWSILPPLAEQTAIANFLDDKTALIDKAIAQKEKLIALLKERKQILIQNAVTGKVLNYDANDDHENYDVKEKNHSPSGNQKNHSSRPMKDSGVEWIGEIPENWEVRKFKFLCHITTGAKNTEDKIENGMYPFFVRSQIAERINSFSFDGEAILTAGDGAGVGKVFHYINGKFDFHQRVYKFSNFKNIKGKFLFYYLRNTFHNVALTGEAKSTVDSLRLPLIQNFIVTIPPNLEQEQIISFIETQSTKIDNAISLQEKQIEKLKEYKSVLIDSAVTGKIKVS